MGKKQSAFRSPWVLGWIGLLVVFVSANVIMIYLSTDHPGLVDKDYYERGQNYEKNMLKRMARDPGWNMKIHSPEYADVGKPVKYRFSVHDKSGAPVTPDKVTFYAYRPADEKQDFSVDMLQVASGEYEADITYPLLGVWDVLVSVKHGEDEYNVSDRISAGVE